MRLLEAHVKELVLRGVTVNYVVRAGGEVGWTPGREQAWKKCTPAIEQEIIEIEASLAKDIFMECQAFDGNKYVNVFTKTISNYVPETVPYILKKKLKPAEKKKEASKNFQQHG